MSFFAKYQFVNDRTLNLKTFCTKCKFLQAILYVKVGDNKSMIAGLIPSSGVFVDPAITTFIGHFPGRHNVIQPPADVSFKAVRGAIVPKCILFWFRMFHSENIDKAPINDVQKRFLNRFAKTHMAP